MNRANPRIRDWRTQHREQRYGEKLLRAGSKACKPLILRYYCRHGKQRYQTRKEKAEAEETEAIGFGYRPPPSMKLSLAFRLAVCFCVGAIASAQTLHLAWKEYSFPEDGFTISLPQAPRKHPDKNLPNATAYSVNINPDHAFTLRVKNETHPCKVVLDGIRKGVLSGGILYSDPNSLKDISLQGHPGLSYEWTILDDRLGYFRYYCVDGKLYILAAKHERNHPFLPEYLKIMDSFRITSAKTK